MGSACLACCAEAMMENLSASASQGEWRGLETPVGQGSWARVPSSEAWPPHMWPVSLL